MADVRARMLTLLSLLQSGRPWGATELAERLGISPRSLRRDIDRLRELGYPVDSRPGPGGSYRLGAGAAVPPLLLDDGEAVAVAVGLRLVADASVLDASDEGAAGRALLKLDQVLPRRLRDRVAGVHAVTEAAAGRTPDVRLSRLSALGDAAHRHERVELTYRDRDGVESTRQVEPYRQVLTRGRWYLLGYDLDRDGWRTFRLDRIGEVTPTRLGFRPRPLPAETAAEYLDAALREPRHRAVVTFLAPIDQVADRLPVGDGQLDPLDGDRCRFTTWVDSFAWLAVRVAMLGIEFRVEEPASFVEACDAMAEQLARAAGRR